jgi:hypothetical protein
MAKKRLGSSGLLGGLEDAQRAGQQATGQRDTTRAGQYRRKSYLLTDDLVERVAGTAEAQRVGINELVRWALAYTLDGLDSGEIRLPVVEETRRRIASE